MVERFLITTPIEETWPNSNCPVIFLGEWCRLYNKKRNWSHMEAVVMPYHWNDRKKLEKDYYYIQNIYEITLRSLSYKLNEFHKKDYSERYWRIVLGPWLSTFIEILYDRWYSIKKCYSEYEIKDSIILDYNSEGMIPNCAKEFRVKDDHFNHYLYGEIIKYNKLPHSLKKISKSANITTTLDNDGHKIILKKKIVYFLNLFSTLFTTEKDIFITTSYLSKKEEYKLYFLLNQYPFMKKDFDVQKTIPNMQQRNWVLNGLVNNDFEKFVSEFVPKNIPTAYLEGYEDLEKLTENLPWPKNPPVIFTSNSFKNDDVFKVWAAKKTENNSHLYIGQHGGSYGMLRFNTTERHEIKISDRYFTWGWDDPNNKEVVPIGQIINRKPLRVDHKKNQKILMITSYMPRYSTRMYNSVFSSQVLNYLDDLFEFTAKLDDNLKKNLIVRLKSDDTGWCTLKRWSDKFPNIALDKGFEKIENIIKKSRIYVHTENSTTFLESFTMNVPTVMFWNPNHWELRESAIPYFEMLKKCGIYHETPESAANHINHVWNKVDEWWNDKELKQAIKCFCSRYAHVPMDISNEIFNQIKSSSNLN
jgi:putative transferase (TIGR04331 family)